MCHRFWVLLWLPKINVSYEQQKSGYHGFFGMVALTTWLRFYLFKAKNRNSKNTRAWYEMFLELRVKIPEWRHDFVLVSLLLTSNRYCTFIWCFRQSLWSSERWLSRWIIERNLFWTRLSTLAHLHTSISPSELVIFNWLTFPN